MLGTQSVMRGNDELRVGKWVLSSLKLVAMPGVHGHHHIVKERDSEATSEQAVMVIRQEWAGRQARRVDAKLAHARKEVGQFGQAADSFEGACRERIGDFGGNVMSECREGPCG